MKRYMIATVHDNDFSSRMIEGIDYIESKRVEWVAEEEYKNYLIWYLIFHAPFERDIKKGYKFKTVDELKHSFEYLNQMEITYTDKRPAQEWDNAEYVIYDFEAKYSWLN